MSENADLIGKTITFEIEDSGEWTVSLTTEWGDYVCLTRPSETPGREDMIIRRASDVRRRLQLDKGVKK